MTSSSMVPFDSRAGDGEEEETRAKLFAIEERYGEDFADAISYAVYLFNHPDAPDRGAEDDSDVEDDWSLHHFLLALGPDTSTIGDVKAAIRQAEEWRKK